MTADHDWPELTEADPFARFSSWLPRVYSEGEDYAALTLSTVDADGYPEGRTVLLSSYSRAGFCFHADSRSRKSQQLRASPRASMTFLWPDFGHQVVIQGDVQVLEDGDDAFMGRPRYLQLLSWLNTDEMAQLELPARRLAFAEFDAEHRTLLPPPTWIGFRLVPRRFAFWQGASDATSQRLEFRRDLAAWKVAKLPG